MAESGEQNAGPPVAGGGFQEETEIPRTRWPAVAATALLISMFLVFLTAGTLYYNAKVINDMDGTGEVVGLVHEYYDDKHIPIENMNISVVGTGISTLSDENGQYKLPKVPAGIQKLKYEKPGYETLVIKVIIYSDSDLDTEDFEPNNFTIPGNIRFGIDVDAFLRNIRHIPLEAESGILRGKAVNQTGQPLENINISYSFSDTTVDPVTLYLLTNASGEFVIDLYPGRYSLGFSGTGFQSISQEVLVAPGNETVLNIEMVPGNGQIDIPLNQTGVITGSIVTTGGTPVDGVMVEIDDTGISAVTNQAGEYTLENVPLGTHNIIVSGPGYSLVSKTVFLDGNTVTDIEVDVMEERYIDNSDLTILVQCALVYIIIGIILLVAGVLAFRRRVYGFAIMAAILGFISSLQFIIWIHVCITSILCIIAIVAVFVSRKEFS